MLMLCLAWSGAASGQSSGGATEHEHPGPSPLRIGGFSDINFAFSDDPGSAKGFSEGQVVLHFNSLLSPRFTFFGEVSMTARPATPTAASNFSVAVERMLLKYDLNDAFKLSFGRFHTPVNWWNVAFHHGQWLQTTIARPEMTRFGGKFIPVHYVGALAEGALPSGSLNLNYKAGVGNGRGQDVNDAGDAGDTNRSLAWLANLFVRPDAAYDLQLGGSYYRDKFLVRAAPPLEFQEDIVSGFLVWLRETPEFIAEYAHIRHEDTAGATFEHDAWYAQAGWRLPGSASAWKPYARYEDMQIEPGDAAFAATVTAGGAVLTAAVTDRTTTIAGVRFDFADYAAAKAEFRRDRTAGAPAVDGLHLQVSFAF
ncbi:MAG: hypothetical protein ACRETF_06425 [Nevskiaceae bacterium]